MTKSRVVRQWASNLGYNADLMANEPGRQAKLRCASAIYHTVADETDEGCPWMADDLVVQEMLNEAGRLVELAGGNRQDCPGDAENLAVEARVKGAKS